MSICEIRHIGDYLNGNPYVGRGIVAGRTENGTKAAIAYFIMGRSENSRNRVFEIRDGVLYTKPFDAEKVADPSLIIYAAMRDLENSVIVTNGDQTDTIFKFMATGKSFEEALRSRTFEPDAPNYTPRISGLITLDGGDISYKLSILKSADASGSACQRQFFEYDGLCGVGHFIHTYRTDGSPLPPFDGEPKCVKIPDDIDAFTRDIWQNLDENNKISLYVRYVDITSGTTENRLINGRLTAGIIGG